MPGEPRADLGERTVKTGTFLYAGDVVCDLRIVYSPTRYGTGDCNDPPEVSDDRARDSYYIWYGSTTQRGQFSAGGGGFDTLAEAVRQAEASVAAVAWNT